jgi:hypothetical protein
LVLGEDLRAVLADAQLRLRELWRRNGEGGLWRPGWWPRDLAALFWPIALAAGSALLLALLAGGLALLLKALPAAVAPDSASPTPEVLAITPAGSAPTAEPTEAAQLPKRSPIMPETAAAADDARTADAGTGGLAADAAERERTAVADPVLDRDSTTPDSTTLAPTIPDPSGPVDPLEPLMERPEAAGLIEAVRGDAENGTLTLQLSPAFERLSGLDQRRRAELWQGWAQELGYDHLDLRDRRAGLRGRDALVGDGMILFSPQPPT